MKWTTDEFTGKQFGKYEVLCRLAVGGMAEIFLGFGRQGPFVGRTVVLKRILQEQREDPAALQMLIDEAKLTATLSHPNVAQVLDLEMAGDDVVLVIEFIAGANTEEVVEVYQARGEQVPLGFALSVIREAAQGLAHAHGHQDGRGKLGPVIHRDVTPRNIMVDFGGAIKVLDFGIARAKGTERRTQVGMVRGTTAYMSPEQAVGKELDPRTDLFSLGIVAHELLTGQRLFYKGNPAEEMAAVYEAEIPPPSRVNRRVSKAVDAVVMRALERKLERRYLSALELIRDLALAAGSTAWSRDRCAEMVRSQFASRQKDIERLCARIPSWSALPDAGRTIIGRGGPDPASFREDEPAPKTVLSVDPLSARPPRLAVPRERAETLLDAPRPASPPSLARDTITDSGRSKEPRGDAGVAPWGALRPRRGERPGERMDSERPTDSRRDTVPRQRAVSLLAGAALGALLVGGGAGALIYRWAQPPVATAMSRVVIEADRPAEVSFEEQRLGTTPLVAVFPVGRHVLRLKDVGGTVRVYEVEVRPGADNTFRVALDAPQAVP